MAKVGDVIMKVRVLGPDLPATIGQPDGLTISVIADNASTLSTGTHKVRITQWNHWGESNPTTQVDAVIAANQAISVGGSLAYSAWAATTAYVLGDIRRPTTQNGHAYRVIVAGTSAASEPTFPLNSGGTVVDGTVTWQEFGPAVPAGIEKYRAYFGVGAPTQYKEGTSLPIQISAAGTIGTPPTESSAYNPDSDGGFVSAKTFFEWLNDGLKAAARLVGGIRDATGIRAIKGNGHYIMTGQWSKITHGWFDGNEMSSQNRTQFFYRSGVSGLTNQFAFSHQADRMLLELDPQPNRSGASTTLSAALSATGTTAPATSTANFDLDFGLAKIGTEIVAYQGIAANQLTNLIRGLGGTKAQAWSSGAAVEELNLRFAGLRLHTQEYVPGDSTLDLPVPVGWESVLHLYVLAMFREGEQEMQEATVKRAEFRESLLEWGRANKQPGPWQLPLPSQRETTRGGLGGGWLVN